MSILCEHPFPMSGGRCGQFATRFFSVVTSPRGGPQIEAVCENHATLYDQVFVRAGICVEITMERYLLLYVHET